MGGGRISGLLNLEIDLYEHRDTNDNKDPDFPIYLYNDHFTGGTSYDSTRWSKPHILQLLSEVHIRTCDTVAKRPIPCMSNGSLKMFKISPQHEHAQMKFLLE